MNERELKEIELELLLDAIQKCYGHDFHHYARASLKRRVASLMSKMQVNHIGELIPAIIRDEQVYQRFVREMSVTVTEMFRDPSMYAMIRKEVIPHLKTYPFIKIWHAGCATGEEVYSMAIMLKEEGLYDRAHIYATDFNSESLDYAMEGVYPLEKMKNFMEGHRKSGTTESFSEYYHAKYESAKFSDSLKENITFANHNLVTDGVFGEMNLIMCRNVVIYFDKELQNRVFKLFRDSLTDRGFLCLGSKETMDFSEVAAQFETVSQKDRIYRKRSAANVGSTKELIHHD